jgi:hypothetical protein
VGLHFSAWQDTPLIFFRKIIIDPQHVISSLNFDRSSGTLHRLTASESFRASSFHAGAESNVTNSYKNQKNARHSHVIISCHLDVGKNSNLTKRSLLGSPFTKMAYHFNVAWILDQTS